MDVPRMLGKAIVMIIPTFVGAGVVWDILESYTAVCVWVVIVAVISGATVFRKDIQGRKTGLSRR